MKKFLLLSSVGLASLATGIGVYIVFSATPEAMAETETILFFFSRGKLLSSAVFSGLLSVSTLFAGAFYPKAEGVDLHV